MAKTNLSLVDSIPTINKNIINAIKETLEDALKKSIVPIDIGIKNMVRAAIINSEEYRSLVSGRLRGEFGVVDAQNSLSQILDIWVNSINVINKGIKATPKTISGGISIQIIQRNFDDVLNSSASSYITEKGVKIPWLQWLLLAGQNVVVRDYTVVTDLNSQEKAASRTGEGLMVQTSVSFYRVPAIYAGTIDDNMVTRALIPLEDEMLNLIQTTIENNI